MNFEVTEQESPEHYRLLTGGVTPRPIAWISTQSNNKIDNLAPYSFFTVVSCNPPVLLYTQVTQRNGIHKDTYQNLLDTGECVVNIVSSDLIEKMNQTSIGLDFDINEFDFAGIESCKSHKVKPPSVKDSPIRYECALRETISISELPAGGTMVLLDVKSIYVRDDLYENGKINQSLVASVGKLGGDHFSLLSGNIELKRP